MLKSALLLLYQFFQAIYIYSTAIPPRLLLNALGRRSDLHPKLKIRKIIFFQDFLKYISITLREKCQNTEFFLVPIPSERRYLLQLMEKVEMVITRMRWKAVHFNNSDSKDNINAGNTEWYGLKSPYSTRQVKELIPFENDFWN